MHTPYWASHLNQGRTLGSCHPLSTSCLMPHLIPLACTIAPARPRLKVLRCASNALTHHCASRAVGCRRAAFHGNRQPAAALPEHQHPWQQPVKRPQPPVQHSPGCAPALNSEPGSVFARSTERCCSTLQLLKEGSSAARARILSRAKADFGMTVAWVLGGAGLECSQGKGCKRAGVGFRLTADRVPGCAIGRGWNFNAARARVTEAGFRPTADWPSLTDGLTNCQAVQQGGSPQHPREEAPQEEDSEESIEAVENLLESYFMQIDSLYDRLVSMGALCA